MGKKLVNILKYLLSVGLAGLLVWLAFRGIDWHEFFVGLKATRWSWIILYIIVGYLALVFRALRWTQLIHPLDNDIHYGKVWDSNNIGGMVSIALPGSGDLVRTGLLTTSKLPYQTVFGTVMMERAWDILAILLMFVGSLVFAWGRFGGFFVDNIWHPLVWLFVELSWNRTMTVLPQILFRYSKKVTHIFCVLIIDYLSFRLVLLPVLSAEFQFWGQKSYMRLLLCNSRHELIFHDRKYLCNN